MWGKRIAASPDDKRLRCPIDIVRNGQTIACNRLARRYEISKHAQRLGPLDLCNAHVSQMRKQGYHMAKVDRRKKTTV
jgi:hypothetical protein